MKKLESIKYTIEHRRAFRYVELKLLGKNTMRSLFHDLDKIILKLILPNKTVSKIHRKYSRHHNRAHTYSDYVQMVIDWECARFTKPDKPLTAKETLESFYPELKQQIEPILLGLKLYK